MQVPRFFWFSCVWSFHFCTADGLLRIGREYRDPTTATQIFVSEAGPRRLETLKKHRKAEYLSRVKNEIPEWIFMTPGQIEWSEGEEGKRGGRKPIGHKEGGPMDMKNFRNRVFLKACDRAQIRRRRLHDTRHTFASILLMNGESPAYVKEQLGHSSIKMTVDIYGHWIPGSNRQAVNKLPSLSTMPNQKVAIASGMEY